MNNIIQQDLKEIIKSKSVRWQQLEGSTILITGANGMLPSYMVETILYLNDNQLQKKAKIIALCRSEDKAKKRFKDYLDRRDIEFIFQNVCDDFQYSGNIDYIIHSASQASPKYYGTDPVGTLEANVIGTRNLLKLAQEKSVESFLFVSTSEVYGAVSDNAESLKETDYGYLDPATVRACYGESKRLGETMCIAYQHQYNIPAKIIRPFHTYGPSMSLDDGRVYADFVANIIRNEDIKLGSDGSAKRAFCYVTDATIGFFLVLLQGENGQAYNLGNPYQEISIYELATKLVSLFPEKKLHVSRKINNDGYLKSAVNRNCPDIAKIQNLGWQPLVTIEEGFKRVIGVFNDNA